MHERKRKLIKRRKTKLSLEIHIKKNNCTTSFMSVGKLQKKTHWKNTSKVILYYRQLKV